MVNTRSQNSRNPEPVNGDPQASRPPPDQPPESPRRQGTPEGHVTDTATSSPATEQPRHEDQPLPESGPQPLLRNVLEVEADVRLMRRTQQSILERFENKEKRDDLQRRADLEAFGRMIQEALEADRRQRSRRGTRRRERRGPVDGSSSSSTSEPRNPRRDNGEQEQGRPRSPGHQEGRGEGLNRTDRAAREDRNREELRVEVGNTRTHRSPRRGSLREYRVTYLSEFGRSPFSREAATASYPKYFDLADLPKYDGTQDPRNHLLTFEKLMWVRQISGPVIQRLFAATLDGPAHRWLISLPDNSIRSYEDLGRKFELHFATSKKQPKTTYTLSKVRQKKGEALQKYLDRFREVAMQVRTLSEDVHVHCLVNGLDPSSRLARHLCKNPVYTLTEFYTEAKKYLEMEQLEAANADEPERTRKSPHRDEDRSRGTKTGSGRRNQEGRAKPDRAEGRGKYDSYTPLNVPRSQVWREVAQADMRKVERPKPIRGRSNTDRSKFCNFHDCNGHTTDECYDLRDAIEKFVRDGKLRQYVIKTQGRTSGKRNDRGRSRSPPRESRNQQKKQKATSDEEFPEAEFQCNGVSGGFGGGGDTVSQRRKYLREVIAVRDPPRFKGDPKKPRPPALTFTDEDLKDVIPGHLDGLVITGTLVNCRVKRIFVDAGSSADIISWDAYKRMHLDPEDLKPCKTTLVGFNGEQSFPKGYIDLRLTLGTKEAYQSKRVRFVVANFRSPYNVILGRPTIHNWDILVSTKHQKLKMVNDKNQVVVVSGDQKESRQCYFEALRVEEGGPSSPPRLGYNEQAAKADSGRPSRQQVNMVELDLRKEDKPRPEPEGELEEIALGANQSKTVNIGRNMEGSLKALLTRFLRQNQDVFAWTAAEVPGVDPHFCCHKLGIWPGSRPVTQKKRNIAENRQQALEDHVEELLAAGFIREVQYTTWLSNVVMVLKPSGKWRVCVDYSNLNKACPKDSYPMPNIDKLVDNSAGYHLLSFMDAYSGYNQIAMHPEDQEKTAFMTDKANYCYNVMPFGLKNAGATYQRMMNRVFEDQIGRNIEVYIDDMIVKSKLPEDHIRDLEQTFDKLRKYRIRLNPAKCAFGVPAGKFLGFMLTNRGIEANPDKCKAVLDMQPPRTKKEVQQLTGRLAALTRFLPKSAEKALPLFKLLKKETRGGWTPECDAAFTEIKRCLASPPVLTKPDPGETLFLYLSIGNEAVSAALVKESETGQTPIYFTSKVLQSSELRYQKVEKMAYALLTAARRLRPYFQGHRVVVRTGQPIRQILHKPDLAGRMTNWAIELSEFDIAFEARRAIKSQALADFIREFTSATTSDEVWKVYVDGSSNSKGSGAGVIVESPQGVATEHSLQLEFQTSNNQAEYEALLAGLLQAKENGAQRVMVLTDSQLVTAQINGTYQAKGPLMAKYLNRAKELMAEFEEVTVSHIPREENARADILSKLASTKGPDSHRTVIQQNLTEPSCVMTISAGHDWRKPIEDYIERGIIPTDVTEAKKLIREATLYAMVDDQLYRRGLHCPMMRCLGESEAKYVLAELHEGSNGHHMGGKALARKALRAGYYWPTMNHDAMEKAKTCDSCQKHARIIWPPPSELKGMPAPWPFYKWGMDILGPFRPAQGQCKWLIVAVDYFTKWIEAEPLATITSARVMKFFRHNIVSRFGIPAEVVTDNGTQFMDHRFQALMSDLDIKQHFSSVEHPQTNGQAEAANKIILDGLKRRMLQAETSWTEQLHSVLWGYRTSTQSSTQETPYRLTYGCEAMIPVEIGQPSWRKVRARQEGQESNDDALKTNLDLIDEIRVTAHCRELAAKQLLAAKYNRKVRPRAFSRGNLVLRRADIGNKNAKDGKLAANWEGPYRVKERLDGGAYTLETLARKPIKRTWNADKLKIYYS